MTKKMTPQDIYEYTNQLMANSRYKRKLWLFKPDREWPTAAVDMLSKKDQHYELYFGNITDESTRVIDSVHIDGGRITISMDYGLLELTVFLSELLDGGDSPTDKLRVEMFVAAWHLQDFYQDPNHILDEENLFEFLKWIA